jgi:hypothetical protein
MARRRRSYYEDERPQPNATFTWGNLVNLGGIPLLTAAAVFVGQWALTGDTLKRHDASLKEIVVSREDEKKARDNVRTEFLASQSKLVDVLNKLDTRLSVSEKQQELAGRQIEKISDILQQNQQPPTKTRR